jgi:hypothetical protein
MTDAHRAVSDRMNGAAHRVGRHAPNRTAGRHGTRRAPAHAAVFTSALHRPAAPAMGRACMQQVCLQVIRSHARDRRMPHVTSGAGVLWLDYALPRPAELVPLSAW